MIRRNDRMKKIKSKLALLFSVALLGTMFIVPSASAETTEQWATLYEQNFKEEGLTKDEVIADGLYLNAEKWWINTSDGLRTSSTDQYVYYTQDLGNKYKISGTFNYGGNSWPIIYGGTINEAGTQISGKQLLIDKNGAKAKLDGEALQNCYDAYATHKFELLYDNGTVTVTMKDSDGTVKETKSKTYDSVFSSNYFGWVTSGSYVSHMAMYDLRIEVPSDYTEYKTTYNETFTYSGDAPYTLDKVKEDWILSDNITATTGGLTAISPVNEEGKAQNSTAYAWYNHNLGTNYKAELKFNPKYYGGTSYCFNATTGNDKWGNVNAMKNGYVISIPQDWSSDKITLYKVDNETWIKLLSGTFAFGYSGVITINVECNNGQITVTASRGSVSDTVTYDATADIAANSAFASGLIGMHHGSKAWNTGSEFFKVVGLKVQQPDTDNTLSTLVTSVADDNTVTYSVKANNNGTTALEGAKVIVAAYEAGGRFLGAKMTDCTHMGQTTVSGEIPVTEGKTPAKVKAFFFDGLTNIKPLASSISKTL